MYKKKFFFIVFEGIEGSGKSYQSKRLFYNLKKKGIESILTREPGGTKTAEIIRKIILKDYFNGDIKKQFDKYTDTLLYLAARNEHIKNLIKPISKKRKYSFVTDLLTRLCISSLWKTSKKPFIDKIHDYILQGIKPDITFVMKIKISKALKRLKKRKKKNRYDKFSQSFYIKAQNAFIKIGKKDKKKYFILYNSNDSTEVESKILDIVTKKLK